MSCEFFSQRPYVPSHNQITTETEENRAPPSDPPEEDSTNNSTAGAEARKSVLSSSPESASENQDAAGSDPDKVSFIPGHARSFSEPARSGNNNRSTSQLSRISGYSTGHSFSSSLEGRSSRRYSILEWCWHTKPACTHHFFTCFFVYFMFKNILFENVLFFVSVCFLELTLCTLLVFLFLSISSATFFVQRMIYWAGMQHHWVLKLRSCNM